MYRSVFYFYRYFFVRIDTGVDNEKIVGLIFYFMILRPQQKRTKEHKKLMDSIAKGDGVLTNGGLVGRVTKVAENGYIAIALNDTTEVVIKRDFVAAVLPKGTMKAL